MLNRWMKLIAILILSGCGVSPLFNHESSGAGHSKPPFLNPRCPLNFSKVRLCAKLDWIHGPNTQDENSFFIKFWDKTGGGADGPYTTPNEDLQIQLWMPAMGHGSAPVLIAQESTGTFRVSSVFFTMRGDWQLRFKLMDHRRVVDESVLPIKAGP
jgi:hypothetical protein